VHNALYAVRESGEIHITTKVERNLVTLTVADSGHGIAKENLDKLFDPFFTTKPPGQGIGVGLSTCYNIIKKHGGDIGVESTQGQGAVFEIVLPYFEE
jgi:signal transduction histidine kinase